MSEDHEERGARRRKDVLEVVMRAADAGDILSVPELKKKLPWGDQITKHGLIWIINTLEEQGYVERRWGRELGPMVSGKVSFVLPKKLAYETRPMARAGR